jgi:hypothetical protein
MPFSGRGRQGPLEECLIRHNLIVDQMFLDDPLNYGGSGGFVPDAFGVDHHDRALLADAEAIGFRAEDATGTFCRGLVQSEFLQAAFEVIPGGEAIGFVAADRLGLVSADQDVPIDLVKSEFGDSGLEGGVGGWVGRGGFCHGVDGMGGFGGERLLRLFAEH